MEIFHFEDMIFIVYHQLKQMNLRLCPDAAAGSAGILTAAVRESLHRH